MELLPSEVAVSARCLLSAGENAEAVCVVVFGMNHSGQGFGKSASLKYPKPFQTVV
jgi:hypothetical protein